MRADLAVATEQQKPEDLLRSLVARDRPCHDVGRPDAVHLKQRVERWQRVNVFECLVLACFRAPLIVAFGVDADEQARRHRS